MTGSHEVVGSIPISSTIFFNSFVDDASCLVVEISEFVTFYDMEGLAVNPDLELIAFFFAILHALPMGQQEELKDLIILDNYNKYDNIQIFIITNDT